MGFAQNLAHCMKQRGYSAYRLAQILDVNNQSVLNWVAGGSMPHTKNRKKIADHFGITLAALDGDALPTVPPETPAAPAPAKKEPPAETGEQFSPLDSRWFSLTEEEKLQAWEFIVQLRAKNQAKNQEGG